METTAKLDRDACYAALSARDRRFDGVFYVGVSTTGIYCRPICPARLPAQDRCEFFDSAANAEQAGFRACFRCRPELAPGRASVDAGSRLAQAATRRIEAGYLNEHSVDELGEALGVTARHLRRVMVSEVGATPVEIAQSVRLALGKRLLQDTRLPLADVAFAAGFGSVRRFNALFQERFSMPPSSVRRAASAASADGDGEAISLRLDYRPPLDWSALLGFLGSRAIPGIELVTGDLYSRVVASEGKSGRVTVRALEGKPALEARVSSSLSSDLLRIVSRLRRLFDLDARPDLIADRLGDDPLLAASIAARPGLRVPGAFDSFELMVRAVLGQQVSVSAASTLCGRFVARFGPAVESFVGADEPARAFPSPEVIAAADVEDVKAVGMPRTRARTLVALASAVVEGRVDTERGDDPEKVMADLKALPGIGDWTAQYIAMRALQWPNAFPAGDLVLRKAMGVDKPRDAESRAEPWQPWRAYATMHLWNEAARAARKAPSASGQVERR